MARREATVEALVQGVLAGDRAALGQAITRVESTLPAHRTQAVALLRAVHGRGKAHRIGISGPPGVGKSTFIEALGTRLVQAGHRVAVLAIDPSSQVTGGSILGDKTRMQQLANHPAAFVRPSPARGALGGVAARTGDALTVVEAAGYDVVIVETVGVGQSEIEVGALVDTFLVLLLPGAGDDLQGLKKGLLEQADVVAFNKADGDGKVVAELARRELEMALRLVAARRDGWDRPVLACSALTGEGLEAVWKAVQDHAERMRSAGRFEARRREQRVAAMWRGAEHAVLARWREQVQAEGVEALVENGEIGVAEGVARLTGS